jgi:hypothetical protein
MFFSSLLQQEVQIFALRELAAIKIMNRKNYVGVHSGWRLLNLWTV